MIYVDTSFIAPLFREEATSADVERYLASTSEIRFAISGWTRVEFASLVARDLRMKTIDAAAARSMLDAFDDLTRESLHVLTPTTADFDLAQRFVVSFVAPLRGPDALHLAVAANNGADEILSLDDAMLTAAKKLKIKARRGIRLSRGQ